MAVITEPGDTREDERGAQLAQVGAAGKLNPQERAAQDQVDAERGISSLSDEDKQSLDDMEKEFGDDSSSSGGSSSSSSSKSSGKSSPQAKSATPSTSKPGASGGSVTTAATTSFGRGGKKQNKPLLYALIFVMASGLLGGGFLSLLPLKLESMMKNILEKRVEQRLKHYMFKRLINKDILKDYFKASLGATDAEFEANIAGYDDATKAVLRNYRKAKIEDILDKRTRLKVTKDPAGNLQVFKDGELLGTLEDPEVEDTVLNGLFDISKGVNFMYRGPMRYKLFARLYGIVKSKFFDGENDPQQAEVEVRGELVDDASINVASGDAEILNCIFEEGCEVDESSPDKTQRIQQVDEVGTDTGAESAGTSEVQQAVVQGEATATSKFKTVISKLNYLNPNYYLGKIVSKLLSKFLGTAIADTVEKFFAAAAGPLLIISAIDIASHIDHFFWYGGADKVLVNIHKVQYAAQFAEWSIIGDQWKSGQNVSGAEFNSINGMLSGTENSAASENIYGTGSGGQSLDQLDNGKTSVSSRSIDEQHFPIEQEYKNVWLPALAAGPAIGLANAIFPNLPGISQLAKGSADVLHYLLLAWYDTLGKVWGLIQKLLSLPFGLALKAIEHIPLVGSAINWAMHHAGLILADLLKHLIQPAVDGTEVGADLMNGIDAGGAVVGMDFARTLGGHLLTPAQSAAVNQSVAEDQQQAASHMSLADRLFNTNYAQSAINLLALRMPSTTSGAISDGMNYVASIALKPYEAVLPAIKYLTLGNALAANGMPQNQYGLNDWGLTDQDLAQNDNAAIHQAFVNAAQRLGIPVAKVRLGQLELNDCPMTPGETTPNDHTANMCRFDIAMDRSMDAAFTTTDDGGLNSSW